VKFAGVYGILLRVGNKSYGLGTEGHSTFEGSVVTFGKSLRAALYAAHADLDSVDKGESFP